MPSKFELEDVYECVGDTLSELFIREGVMVGTNPMRDSANLHGTVQFYFVDVQDAGLMNGTSVFKILRCNDLRTLTLEFMGLKRTINEDDFWPGESGWEEFEFSVIGAVQDLISHWYTSKVEN